MLSIVKQIYLTLAWEPNGLNLCQSGPESNGKEEVHFTPQRSRSEDITRCSLVLYLGMSYIESIRGSYLSTKDTIWVS